MHNMLMCVSLCLCFLCVVCLCAGFLTQMWEFVSLCFLWVACLCAGFLTQMWEFVSLCFFWVVCLLAGFLTQMWEFVSLCFFLGSVFVGRVPNSDVWVCVSVFFLGSVFVCRVPNSDVWVCVSVFFLGSVFVCRVPKVFESLGEMICHLQDHECQKRTQINCGSWWNSGKFHTSVVYYYISVVSQNGNTLIHELWNEGCTRIAWCELKLNRTHMHTQTCIYTCT